MPGVKDMCQIQAKVAEEDARRVSFLFQGSLF